MHLFSCEFPSLELNFCFTSLNLSCGYFLGKAQLPPVLEVFCILPKVLSFHLCCSPSWSILLVRKPSRYSTSLIPRGVSHTFAQLPKPERHGFTPDRVTRVSAGRWSALCLLQAGLLFEPWFLPVWWVGFPIGSQVFSRFLCAIETCSLARWRAKSLSWISRSAGAWKDALLTSQGCWIPVTRR
jgi:hypothetical protein